MRQFLKVGSGVPTLPILAEMHRAPLLWNAFDVRKVFPGTPHAAMDDIWLRGRAQADLTSSASFKEVFTPVFWPAWYALPAVRPLVFALMAQAQAVQLGGILITRLPPGQSILPHVDADSWHAQFFNYKLHVTLAGQSLSRCGDEAVTMTQGDVWTFPNEIEHSISNPGDDDRIVLIVALRCEP